MDIRRGDVVWGDLGVPVDNVQGGIRPVIIVQNDVGNRFSPTTLAVPVTSSKTKKYLPTHVAIKAEPSNGLSLDSLVLTEQHFTISKRNIYEKLGTLSSEQLARVNVALAVSMGLMTA